MEIDSKGTWVNFEIDAPSNDILTEAANKNRRSKRKEGTFRLEEHLKLFPNGTTPAIRQAIRQLLTELPRQELAHE